MGSLAQRLLVLLLLATVVGIPFVCGWWSRPAPNGSLLEAGTTRAYGAMGIPRQVVEGPLAVEGSHWRRLDRALVLGNAGGALVVDLGEPVAARALLVQANAGYSFEVEGSLDGETWQSLWTVPPIPDARGMRTRHLTLDPPRSFRLLRVRNPATTGVAALGAVRAYAEIPAGWPLVGPAQPAPISAFPWLSLTAVIRVKFAVAAAGALLLVAAWWLDRGGVRRPRAAGAIDVSLAVTAAIGALGWWNFLQISGDDYERTYANYWDIEHHWLGAKFAPELGYTELYRCILAADGEAGLRDARLEVKWTRDLATDAYLLTRQVAANPAACTARFAADRWDAFQLDRANFRLRIPPGRQLEMLHDYGYNATPAWGVLGRAVAELRPADSLGLAAAMALDPILLLVSFVLIGTTFGFRATCGALILFGTNYSFGNWSTSGAFLRFDWFAASVAGVCCLKRQRWLLAGVLLALAMSSRLFPGFLIGGVGLHALLQMLRERRRLPSPAMRRFAAGVGLGVLALGALSIAAAGGTGRWQDSLHNTIKHKVSATGNNVGLASATNLLHDTHRSGHERFRRAARDLERQATSSTRRLLLVGAAGSTLLLLGLAARREEPWVCAILGSCWLPFAADITFYYYSGAILFALLCPRAPMLWIPFAVLMVWSAGLGLRYDYANLYLHAWSSVALVGFCLPALVWFAMGSHSTASRKS
jgi:hypothetical protein